MRTFIRLGLLMFSLLFSLVINATSSPCSGHEDSCGVSLSSPDIAPLLNCATQTPQAVATYTLTNNNATPVKIQKITLINNDGFANNDMTIDPTSSCHVGSTLAAGGTCTFIFDFQPCDTPPAPQLDRVLIVNINTTQLLVSTTIDPLIFSLAVNQNDTHLQYKRVDISAGSNVILNDVSTSSPSDIQWCQSTDAATCAYVSTCEVGQSVSSACILWFKSIDNDQTPQEDFKTGTIDITLADSAGSTRVETLNFTKKSNLYVTGRFSTAGTLKTTTANIAQWNNTEGWTNIASSGGGLSHTGYALAIFRGDLFVGGDFSQVDNIASTHKIAVWNDSTWAAVDGSFDVSSSSVQSLFAEGDQLLYAGGVFGIVGSDATEAQSIAQFDGETWSSLGSIPNNGSFGNFQTVEAITTVQNEVYVGGMILCVGVAPSGPPTCTSPNTAPNNIAAWATTSSSWQTLGMSPFGVTGMTYPQPRIGVSALLNDSVSPNTLYIAGNFNTAHATSPVHSNKIVHYDPSSSTWSTVGNNNTFFDNTGTNILSLVYYENTLYAAGQFNPYVAYLSAGTTWTAQGALTATARVLFPYADQLYVGGDFTSLNNVAILNTNTWESIDGGVSNPSGLTPQVQDLRVATSIEIY